MCLQDFSISTIAESTVESNFHSPKHTELCAWTHTSQIKEIELVKTVHLMDSFLCKHYTTLLCEECATFLCHTGHSFKIKYQVFSQIKTLPRIIWENDIVIKKVSTNSTVFQVQTIV